MKKRSYTELVERLLALARFPTMKIIELGAFEIRGVTYPIFLVEMRKPAQDCMRVSISAGIHGDEPAGVEAAIRFMEQHAEDENLLTKASFSIFPCDNPSGWELGTRENADGIDLNRQFAAHNPPDEVKLIMRGLADKCFDLVFEMHEDIDAPGFYLYELADEPTQRVGEIIVQTLSSSGVPINLRREIEGAPAECGIIHPKSIRRFRKTHLPKAVYTYRMCGGHVITLEPPVALLPFEERVRIELSGLCIALDAAIKGERGKTA